MTTLHISNTFAYVATLLALWGLALLICPLTFYRDTLDQNANNNPFRIVMRRGLQYPAAIWAQEYYEARYRLVRIWYGPWMLISRLFGWHKAEERLELMGHAVELAALRLVYDLPNGLYNAYLWREISTMRNGYAAFKGMTASEVMSELNTREKHAEAFVKRHLNQIRKHQ